MRRPSFWIAASAFMLTACSETSSDEVEAPEQEEELAGEVAALEEEVDRLKGLLDDSQAKTAEVRAAADNLENEVARFATEDWRMVTGDVSAASDDIDSAVSELEAVGGY